MATDTKDLGVASVVERTLEDMEACYRESSAAVEALGEAIKRGASPDECWSLFDAVQHGEVTWRDGSMDAVCRTVGACLLELDHAEIWRALYVVLLSHFDIGPGWDDGYALGDEVRFVEAAGRRAQRAPSGDDVHGEKKKAG